VRDLSRIEFESLRKGVFVETLVDVRGEPLVCDKIPYLIFDPLRRGLDITMHTVSQRGGEKIAPAEKHTKHL
jgi:hypothetical protein